MMSQSIQGLIIAAAVMWSVLHVIRKYFPRQIRRMQAGLALKLGRASSPLLRRMGVWLQPTATQDDGCGSGCGSCSGCESNPQSGKNTRSRESQPLTFHRHP
ncbi:MAG TPA: DUF6587 family protein [Herminiimonas sp.]|nr:DUF6587 family protein [Herminiimonas sp.]